MHKMYISGVCGVQWGMWCVGDDSSHLLFSEANLNYHHLHTTYTTGVHAMYNTLRAY